MVMTKTLVIDKYWKTVEIDLENPDPMLKTHCALCWRPLFPEWQNKDGIREIGEQAVAAICWKCSSYGPDKRLQIQTAEEMKEERLKERKERAKERRKFYIPKRKKKVKERADQLNKRPCGCSLKGRHKASCPQAEGYKTKGDSDA